MLVQAKAIVVAIVLVASSQNCGGSGSGGGVGGFGDGTWYVGALFPSGVYTTPGNGRNICQWWYIRKGHFFGNGAHRGPSRIMISKTFSAVRFAGGCNWNRVG